MNTQTNSYDQVLDQITQHIIQNVQADKVTLIDDYDDREILGGNTIVCQLVRVQARIRCNVKLEALPRDYRLVSDGKDLWLSGPDIDKDDPQSLQAVLEERGHELAFSLRETIGHEIDIECWLEWQELRKDLKAWIHSLQFVVDCSGVHLEFMAEVE